MKKVGPSKKHDTFKLVVLSLALLAIAFLGVVNPGRNQKTLGAIAAKVDDEDISNSEFKRRYQREISFYKQYHGADFKPSSVELAQKVLTKLIEDRAWLNTAKHNGSLASIEEVSSRIVNIEEFQDEKGRFSEKKMTELLRANKLTEKSLAKDFRIQLSRQKLKNQILNHVFVSTHEAELMHKLKNTEYELKYVKVEPSKLKVKVSDADLKTYLEGKSSTKEIEAFYKKNKADYQAEKEVQVRQILVSFKGADRAPKDVQKRTKAEAKKRANKLLADIKKSPKKFPAIAKAESDDLYSKSVEGDLGFLQFDEMPKSFSEVAFNLKKNSISSVIETKFGFHIVRVEDIEEAKNITLEEAKSSIASKILEAKHRKKEALALSEQILASLKKGGNVEKTLKDNNLKWKTSPKTSLVSQTISGLPKEFVEAGLNLRKKGDVYSKVLKKPSANYVITLASRTKADTSKLSEEEKTTLKQSLEQSQSYELVSSIGKRINEEYKNPKKHTVYINEDYKALDSSS